MSKSSPHSIIKYGIYIIVSLSTVISLSMVVLNSIGIDKECMECGFFARQSRNTLQLKNRLKCTIRTFVKQSEKSNFDVY